MDKFISRMYRGFHMYCVVGVHLELRVLIHAPIGESEIEVFSPFVTLQ